MKQKGKQLKRVRRYRSDDPVKRKVARFKHAWGKLFKMPVLHGAWDYINVGMQTTNLAHATTDIDTKALCKIFDVPYEIYEASQTHKL